MIPRTTEPKALVHIAPRLRVQSRFTFEYSGEKPSRMSDLRSLPYSGCRLLRSSSGWNGLLSATREWWENLQTHQKRWILRFQLRRDYVHDCEWRSLPPDLTWQVLLERVATTGVAIIPLVRLVVVLGFRTGLTTSLSDKNEKRHEQYGHDSKHSCYDQSDKVAIFPRHTSLTVKKTLKALPGCPILGSLKTASLSTPTVWWGGSSLTEYRSSILATVNCNWRYFRIR